MNNIDMWESKEVLIIEIMPNFIAKAEVEKGNKQ